MGADMSGDVQALAVWLDEHIAGALRFIYGAGADHVQAVEELLSQTAPALLASDWLRDHIAAERADAARQALAPVLALADEWRAIQGGPGAYGDGARGAYRQAAAQLIRVAAGGGEGK